MQSHDSFSSAIKSKEDIHSIPSIFTEQEKPLVDMFIAIGSPNASMECNHKTLYKINSPANFVFISAKFKG